MVTDCPCETHECAELTEDGELCIACRNGACPPDDEFQPYGRDEWER